MPLYSAFHNDAPFIGASSCIDKTQFIQLIVIANVYIFFCFIDIMQVFFMTYERRMCE